MSGLLEREASAAATIARARDAALAALSSLQRDDGHWCGELEGDSILQSEYLLMKWILRQEREPMHDGSDGWAFLQRLADTLRAQQRPDGGWGQYPGAGIDLSATVKAYFSLKLMGDSPRQAHMVRAAEVVRRSGGAEHVNSFSNVYLACLGQVPWSAIPEIPPEIVWLPRWCYFHLDKVSAWSRTMILPLAIVSARRPTRYLDAALGIEELFVDHLERARLTLKSETPALWRAFFIAVNTLLAWSRRLGPPGRERAVAAAFQWIMKRASQADPAPTQGLGAIFPPMVYLQVVFHALGIQRRDPRVRQAEADLDAFIIPGDSGRGTRLQPCFSPVWDTGIALYALADCALSSDDRRVDAAAGWLCGREVKFRGDWARNLGQGAPVGGWFFEYQNTWYPDVDDTAMVAMALKRTGSPIHAAAAGRGVAWLLAMQNDDGGWAAFDRTTHRQLLEYVPFADHNAMQDPSCPDITGRVLECLAWHGMRVGHAAVDRGIAYIRSRQEPEGCFFGRWGVNSLYGTWQAVIGPVRCGVAADSPWIRAAGDWMKRVQKDDGSFGESANSYESRSLMGQGPSTASQTAWGAMVLQELFGVDDHDAQRALLWLARTQLSPQQAADRSQNPDGDPAGSWRETEFTGTGFPRVFYLRYHLYRLSFPLMALARAGDAGSRSD